MYVLKDLWEGNITPADRGYRKGSPYARLVHQANESEDEFYNHLSDAGKKAYQVYCDQQAHVEDVKDCDTFIRGFRLGARMILDVVVDGIQSSKFIPQKQARVITQKITDLADNYTKASLNRQAFVAGRVRSLNESVVKDADRIHEAIATDRKIAFRYFHYTPNKDNPQTYSKSGERIIVSPYALMWNDGNYYLYAYDGKKFRTYRVDRMEGISRPLLEKRDGGDEYDKKNLTDQRAKVFSMYHGEAYNVRIRVHNRLADAVIDQFGKDTMMVPYDDSHFTINVPVELSPPFYARVATFGKSMKILSPEPAVEGMKKFLQKAAEMYQDE